MSWYPSFGGDSSGGGGGNEINLNNFYTSPNPTLYNIYSNNTILYEQGNHIYGTLVVKATPSYGYWGAPTDLGNLFNNYKPKNDYTFICYATVDETNIGTCTLYQNGSLKLISGIPSVFRYGQPSTIYVHTLLDYYTQ